MENNSNKDIAVFTFERGSQIQSNIIESDSYRFVLGIINSMMTRSGVDVPKVGIGGTKEDVCCFIAALIQYQLLYNIEIKLLDGDDKTFKPVDFDPDIEEGEAF
jgi:hypothetical protein